MNLFIAGKLDGEIEISGTAKAQHSLKGKHQRVGNDKAKSYGFEMNYDETYELSGDFTTVLELLRCTERNPEGFTHKLSHPRSQM